MNAINPLAAARRRPAALLSLALGAAFGVVSVVLFVALPGVSAFSPYGAIGPDGVIMGFEMGWRMAEAGGLAAAGLLLPLLESTLSRNEGLARDGERALAIMAGALFLLAAALAVTSLASAERLADPSGDSRAAISGAFAAGSGAIAAASFALGLMTFWQGVATLNGATPLPRWLGVLGVIVGVTGLSYPVFTPPAPVLFAAWFAVIGLVLLVEKKDPRP